MLEEEKPSEDTRAGACSLKVSLTTCPVTYTMSRFYLTTGALASQSSQYVLHCILNSYTPYTPPLLQWMYLHSATSPEKKMVVLYSTGQMTWSKSPPLHQFKTFVSYVCTCTLHAHPDIPEQHSYLSADMIVARTHLTVVVSLVQF